MVKAQLITSADKWNVTISTSIIAKQNNLVADIFCALIRKNGSCQIYSNL